MVVPSHAIEQVIATDDELRWSTWLIEAQHGDETAYATLLAELAKAIRRYLIASFGPMEIVDDCVQECLLAIHLARHTYDDARPIKPWLFAIVRHRTIDQLRKAGERDSDTKAAEVECEPPDPSRALDSGKLLAALSRNLREPLVLTKLMGYSTRECAQQLGVSETVVKVRVHRGIRKLRAMWDSQPHED